MKHFTLFAAGLVICAACAVPAWGAAAAATRVAAHPAAAKASVAKTPAGSRTAATATVVLSGEAEVSSSGMTLGEIAKISSSSPALASALKGLSAGSAPWPGQSIQVDAGQVRLRMKAARLDPAGVVFPEPARVRVKRAAQTVSGQEAADKAKEAVQAAWQQPDRMECDILRAPQDISIRSGKLELVPQPPTDLRPGILSVPVEVRADGKRERTLSVSLRLRVYRQMVTVTQALARGQVVSASDVSLQEKEVAAGCTGALTDIAEAENMRTRRPIAMGCVLRKADLDVVPLVRRGGPVVIEATAGRVCVRANGLAQQDGVMGEMVKVRPDHSREDISAKVTGDGRVTLAL